MDDEHVAETLNEEQFTTGLGRRWSACAVKRIRLEHTAIRRPPNAGWLKGFAKGSTGATARGG
jgi:hypothetical protein